MKLIYTLLFYIIFIYSETVYSAIFGRTVCLSSMNIPWIILYGGIFILLIVLLRNNLKKDRRCTKKIYFLSIGLFFWGLIGVYSLSGTYFDNEDYRFIENIKQKLDSLIKFQKEECLFLNL